MESLNIDTLWIILTRIPYELVDIVSSPNSILLNNINVIRGNNLFWKKRVELFFDKMMQPRQTDWKIVYENIIQALTNKINDKIQPLIYCTLRLGHNKIRTDTISVLLEVYDPSVEANEALILASKYGHTDIVKLLLQDSRVDPSTGNNKVLRYASFYGETEIVELLLQHPRVDPSDGNNEVIRQACVYGHTEIVKLLLQHPHVDPSAENNQAVISAAYGGYIEIVKLLLLDPRVDPSDDNNYAILMALSKGHIEIVELLLQDPRVSLEDAPY